MVVLIVFFVLFVGVLGGFCTTFWVVFWRLFWVWFVFWFALSCGCRINDVGGVRVPCWGSCGCVLPVNLLRVALPSARSPKKLRCQGAP